MENEPTIKRGKQYLEIIIIAFLIFEIASAFMVFSESLEGIYVSVIKSLFFMTFLIITFQYGTKWVAWVTSFLIIFYGLILLLAGILDNNSFSKPSYKPSDR